MLKNTILKTSLALALCLPAIDLIAVEQEKKTQQRQTKKRYPFAQREQKALAEDFKGVTTNGQVEKGLFNLKKTGVSTQPVMEAAKSFLASLTEKQRQQTNYPINDNEWRKWANQHSYKREGMPFYDMSEDQKKLAFNLIDQGLNAYGAQTTKDIMKLNGTLGELTGRHSEYTEWLYWITIMGEPSATKPWGWQLDGHHVVINYFVLGDQVVMTPHFLGSEPIKADSGKFKGTIIMQKEQDLGLAFMKSLNDDQQKSATLQGQKKGANNLSEAFKDNLVLDYAGLKLNSLSQDQKKIFFDLTSAFLQMDDGHAKVKLEEVKEHLDRTYFAWLGDVSETGVYYFRIHSPVILIEFDHQRPIALGRDGVPTRNHIHAVVRTPNGNDYGKDLLRQHYENQHK